MLAGSHETGSWPGDPLDQPPTHAHLPILVVDKDVSSAIVLQVGDLQTMGVTNLSWLEGCIQVLDLHDGLGLLGLQNRVILSLEEKGPLARLRARRALWPPAVYQGHR